MPTEFSFETVFEASSATAILEAYFAPDHLAAQDQIAELAERTLTESSDDASKRYAVWSVRASKPMPMIARPFVEGGRLRYIETMTWRKADGEIDATVQPQLLNGRVLISAVYNLADIGERKVRRLYRGTIRVDASFLSRKIEKAILSEIEKGMPMMRDVTQKWLSRRGV